MRSQLHLRIVLPLALLGLAGLGVGTFAISREPAAKSSAPTATYRESPTPPEQTPPEGPTPLERALDRHGVVVVVLYTPGGAVDLLTTREARAGATAVDAGFLAVDVTDEHEVAEIATAYDVRDAPVLLVFRKGRGLTNRLEGYVDRETVAQAAENARV